METQKTIHKSLRSRIAELKSRSLINGAVLTYHFHHPLRSPTDSLYLCVNVPSIKEPRLRTKQLSEETIKEMPEEIKEIVKTAVSSFKDQFLDRLEIFDYEVELMCNNAPSEYGASIEEITTFAAKGTEIALEILQSGKTRNQTWKNDYEIADQIMEKLQPKQISWNDLHFICNPLGAFGCEDYLLLCQKKQVASDSSFLRKLYSWNEISRK